MSWRNLKIALAIVGLAAVSGGMLAAETPLSASAQRLTCQAVVGSQGECTTYCDIFHPGYDRASWNPVSGCCNCFF